MPVSMLQRCCHPVYAEMLKPRVIALIIAATGAAQLGASLGGWGMPCFFYRMTGIPCPGCGLTRSVLALLHGHLRESLLLHPLGPVLFLGLATALLAAVLPQAIRMRLIAAVSSLERKTGLLAWLLVLLMVIWIIRLAGISPLDSLR